MTTSLPVDWQGLFTGHSRSRVKLRGCPPSPLPSTNQGLLQALQEDWEICLPRGIPQLAREGPLVSKVLLGIEVAKREHTHFTAEETRT